MRRNCLFCGKRPDAKTREHVLPRWLIELTGDPSRVVTHLVEWETARERRFAWNALVFPACASCNSQFAQLEGSAKPVVEKLCAGDPASEGEYVILLDWLDKIRVGLWLGHRYHQGIDIEPTFRISDRIGRKDRLVAIYATGDHQRGLNAHGAETPAFQHMPSVFGLRINNRLLVNASWDWLCAAHCGLEIPTRQVISLDSGLLEASDYVAVRPESALLQGFPKPLILVLQPSLTGMSVGTADDASESEGGVCRRRGRLYRQQEGSIFPVAGATDGLEFDSVSIEEARPMGDIVAEVYELQVASLAAHDFTAEAEEQLTSYLDGLRELGACNRAIAEAYRKRAREKTA
jgi:hypothetical protein